MPHNLLTLTNPFSPEDVINKLIPNGIWPLITQLLTTIVLFIIVYNLAYKPVRQLLDKRATYIKRNIDDSLRDQKLAHAKLSEAERKMQQAKLDSQRLVSSTQEEISASRAEALEQTKDQIRRLKLQADEDILLAQEQAKDDIRKEIVAVAIEASKRVLERELSQDDHEKVVDDFIRGQSH